MLPAELETAGRDFGRGHGLTLAAAVRLLVARGLRPQEVAGDSPALLATLTAAEHAVLMVASILPEGEQRMHTLAARATQSAEERLALFREQPSPPDEGAR